MSNSVLSSKIGPASLISFLHALDNHPEIFDRPIQSLSPEWFDIKPVSQKLQNDPIQENSPGSESTGSGEKVKLHVSQKFIQQFNLDADQIHTVEDEINNYLSAFIDSDQTAEVQGSSPPFNTVILSPEDLIMTFFGENMEFPTEEEAAGFRKHKKYSKLIKKEGIKIVLKLKEEIPFCSECGQKAESNGLEFTRFQTMPFQGSPVYVIVAHRRWKCRSKDCSVKTFQKEITEIGTFNQQRTDLLNVFILALALFTSASGAETICRELGMIISDSEINKMFSSLQTADCSDVEFIGVDDVCLRKGMTYCTAVYDGFTHRLLALLPGRRAKELIEWLKEHPKVKVAARDRATAYAKAISAALKDSCIQVADRYHLLANLLGRLKDIFAVDLPSKFFFKDGILMDHEPETIQRPAVPLNSPELKDIQYDNELPVDKAGNIICFDNRSRDLESAAYKKGEETRRKKYEKEKKIQKEWREAVENGKKPKKKDFANKYGISAVTLNKILNKSAEELENVLEITSYKKRSTDMNDYINIVYKMLRDGYEPEVIYSYILSLGYSGSLYSLRNHIESIAKNNFKIIINKRRLTVDDYPDDVEIVTRSDVLKYITVQDERIKNSLADKPVDRYFEQIKNVYPAVGWVQDAWDDFHGTLMGSDPGKLDLFLERYQETVLAPFVYGIKKDIEPVKNAISYSVSSGFVEGNNCRFKSIKRDLFGRCSLSLLFSRFYCISTLFHSPGEIQGLFQQMRKG